jgi:hypothetical protein
VDGDGGDEQAVTVIEKKKKRPTQNFSIIPPSMIILSVDWLLNYRANSHLRQLKRKFIE